MPIDRVAALTTGARMQVYERHAGPLALAAAEAALGSAAVQRQCVTDLVVVSCTGFSAPGLDVTLIDRLGLQPTVRRTTVGFMGCFGAIVGLRTAAAACRADPAAVVLVVCVELCSLHVRADPTPDNQVASAIFSDGAAATVVASPRFVAGGRPTADRGALGRIATGHSRLLAAGRDWMSWRITDAGFAMTLAREVPAALGRCIGGFVAECRPRRPGWFIVHPGGAGILDAVDQGLGLGGGSGLDAARSVLRRYGNMSSATVLFVLQEAVRTGYRPPALLLAFGPGLTMEGLVLEAEGGQ